MSDYSTETVNLTKEIIILTAKKNNHATKAIHLRAGKDIQSDAFNK